MANTCRGKVNSTILLYYLLLPESPVPERGLPALKQICFGLSPKIIWQKM